MIKASTTTTRNTAILMPCVAFQTQQRTCVEGGAGAALQVGHRHESAQHTAALGRLLQLAGIPVCCPRWLWALTTTSRGYLPGDEGQR